MRNSPPVYDRKKFFKRTVQLVKMISVWLLLLLFYELLPLKALRGGGFLLINLTTAVLSVRYWNQTIANPSKVAGRESICLLHNTESTARSCMCSHSRLLAHSRNRCNKQFSDIYVYIYIYIYNLSVHVSVCVWMRRGRQVRAGPDWPNNKNNSIITQQPQGGSTIRNIREEEEEETGWRRIRWEEENGLSVFVTHISHICVWMFIALEQHIMSPALNLLRALPCVVRFSPGSFLLL